MPDAERAIERAIDRGRPGKNRNTTGGRGSETQASAQTPDDLELSAVMHRYEQLGEQPPAFNIAQNDEAFKSLEPSRIRPHTLKHHGPDLTMQRAPGEQTVEGRIYGDRPWQHRETRSYKWTDHTTMNREVNRYVQENWETIRSDLALSGEHEGGFGSVKKTV